MLTASVWFILYKKKKQSRICSVGHLKLSCHPKLHSVDRSIVLSYTILIHISEGKMKSLMLLCAVMCVHMATGFPSPSRHEAGKPVKFFWYAVIVEPRYWRIVPQSSQFSRTFNNACRIYFWDWCIIRSWLHVYIIAFKLSRQIKELRACFASSYMHAFFIYTQHQDRINLSLLDQVRWVSS